MVALLVAPVVASADPLDDVDALVGDAVCGSAPATLLCTPEQVWVARYDGPVGERDGAEALAVSPDGTKVFVTGGSTGNRWTEDYAAAAYDAATGEEIWLARYDGPRGSWDQASDLTVTPDGSTVFVTGASTGLGTTGVDFATVAYDAATGEALWSARYNGPGNGADHAQDLAVSPDGSKVFVTGYGPGVGTGINDYATVAYDAATGDELWVARYHGNGNPWAWTGDRAHDLAVSPDGATVFVTGDSNGERSIGIGAVPDYLTVAYDAETGDERWVARHLGPGGFGIRAFALDVSPDGSRVFVTGQDNSGGTPFGEYGTVAYDAETGEELWVSRYDNSLGYVGTDPPYEIGIEFISNQLAWALRVSPDGSRVFLTGQSGSTTTQSFDYATIAYDADTGEELWVARYDAAPTGADYAYAVDVSPDGSHVYVTGQSWGAGTSLDYATVAYDAATGTERWVARYDGPGHGDDGARALGLSPDGSRLYVAGQSLGDDTGSDFATIAYALGAGLPIPLTS